MSLASIARSIREARGLSQAALAQRAGVSQRSVQRLETPGEAVRRSTAIVVLDAIDHISPLSADERSAYLQAAGLGRLAEGSAASAAAAPVHAAQSLRAFTGTLPPDEQRVYWHVADLLEQTSPATLLKLLEAAAALAGVTLEGVVPDDRTFTVSHPPRRRPDGSLEQVFVDYTAPAAKPKPTSRRKRA